MQLTKVYVGLGGNEGQVSHRLHAALQLFCQQKAIVNVRHSHFYRTAPYQMNSPLWFINAVCSFETSLKLDEVFHITKSIEAQLGKVAKLKNADRPIDLDILFFGDQVYQDGNIEIPHPRWKERLFVLFPLADLIKDVSVSSREGGEHYHLQDLINTLQTQSTQQIYLLEKNPDL